MLGVVPPDRRGLHVDCVGTGLFEEVFGALGEGGGGVGGSDESEGAARGRVCEGGLGVRDGVEAVGHSVVDVAIDVGRSDEPVRDLSAH